MKTQRQFLCAAWLAACALLLLSACRGPTPIAGRVAEITATGGASNTPLPAPDTPTPTATPTPTVEGPNGSATPPPLPPTETATTTPPATDAPVPPDDTKPARPTETPVVLNIKPPEIPGYTHSQKEDGTWVYRDGTGKEVAHTATFSFEGLNWKKSIQRGALVVSDEKLMAYLLKTAGEGRGKSEIPLFPLPFNPEGLTFREVDFRGEKGKTDIFIKGGLIPEFFQPLPGGSPTLRNDFGPYKRINISPTDDWGLNVYAPDFKSPLKPFYQTSMPFLAPLASDFSSAGLPPRFGVPGASAMMTIGSSSGGQPLTLGNFASVGGFTVAAGR